MSKSLSRTFLPPSGAVDTSDATAEQWDVKEDTTAYIASGKVTGTAYRTMMCDFSEGANWYDTAHAAGSTTGYAIVARFKCSPLTVNQFICYASSTTGTFNARCLLAVMPSNDANNPSKLWWRVSNSVNTPIISLFSTIDVDDDEYHTVYCTCSTASGPTTYFYIDGNNVDDTGATGRIKTTGTLSTYSNGKMYVGGLSPANTGVYMRGSMGYFGWCDTYRGDKVSTFMQADGSPKNVEGGTYGFGYTPDYWNQHGFLADNKGGEGSTNITQQGSGQIRLGLDGCYG